VAATARLRKEDAMNITLHISFPGTCEAAFRFYQRCLGGEMATMLTWGDSPSAEMVPPEWRGKICHATLRLGKATLAGADPPPQAQERPGGFQILLEVEDAARAEQVFAALAENGAIKMPLQKTFWTERFGILVDQFGVQWEVQPQAPQSASAAES
jgi:PhnB protein